MSDMKRYFLHALTPIHSGTGQGVGVIDLPIAREKATGWPVLPASGVKGVLRDAIGDKNPNLANCAFGKQGKNGEDMTVGEVVLTDAQILCFPVRSFFGTFAYITCPLAITRFNRFNTEMQLPGLPVTGEEVRLHSNTVLKGGTDSKVYLEDLDMTPGEEIKSIAEAVANFLFTTDEEVKAFTSRFAVVSDEIFSFLCETATEVSARVRLDDDTKTVTSGGLWYEEAVPSEALFSGIMMQASHVKKNEEPNTLEKLKNTLDVIGTVQIGGKSSVGRGLCRLVVRP